MSKSIHLAAEKAHKSIIDVIGNTPSVWLDRMVKARGIVNGGRILAKLDYLNPGFSKKDHVALAMILEAKRTNTLRPQQTVVELTSGNTGTGLAIVCGQTGHPFVAVMSRGNSLERARMMKALGAEVVLVNQAPGSLPGQVSGMDLVLVEEAAQQIVIERNAFRANQFLLQSCVTAHEMTTAKELWSQSGESLTAFCDFVGTGSTFAGTIKALRQYSSNNVKGYIVEPAGAVVLAVQQQQEHDISIISKNPSSHPIQGGGYMMNDLKFLKDVPVDGYVAVTGDEARWTARLLAKQEGIFAGFSAGANVAAALKLLEGPEQQGGGVTIGVIICDSGLKYLSSTDLWED